MIIRQQYLLSFFFYILSIVSFSNAASIEYDKTKIIETLNYYNRHKILGCSYEYKPPFKDQRYKLCSSIDLKKCSNKVPIGFYKYHKKVFNIANFILNKSLSKKEKEIIAALITCESNQNPKTVAIDNGYGLFQLTNLKNGNTLDIEQNSKLGLKLLYTKYKSADNLLKEYFLNDYNRFSSEIKQHYTLRFYNGGSLWIEKIQQSRESKNYNNQNEYFYSLELCQYRASKINKRFVCFEKLNLYYPLKIIIQTSDIYKNIIQ